MKPRRQILTMLVAAAVYLACLPVLQAQTISPDSAESFKLQPEILTGSEPSAPAMSASQREAMLQLHLARREWSAGHTFPNLQGPPGLPLTHDGDAVLPGSAMEEGIEAVSEFHGVPSAFRIGRNNRYPVVGSAISTLAEPAAANDGPAVFYTANWSRGFSNDGGFTWTSLGILAGPADAPLFCCDQDVVHDHGRGVTIWSALYLNANQTNGVVRIFVRRTIPGGDACSYTIDPGGLANNIVPDYPHLGLSNKFLYLSTNNLQNGVAWVGSQMRRLNLDEVVDCVGATVNLFTYTGIVGQRVFVPVRAATDVMYFATEENNTQLRIFLWAENAAAPSQFLRTVSASNHVNPDCRGGLNNTDWIERTTSWAILGFRMRGALGRSFSQSYVAWYWNVAQDATHAQAYVHGAVFDARTLALLAQPNISSSTTCFGYPDVNGNSRGDLAMSIASGGRRFGGGPAVQGYIGMDDEFTIGIGNFSPFALVAAGTHNPPDARYGDYVNVSVHEPCDLAFTATAYALQNGTAAANVNRRYVEFVRGRYLECYTSRRNSSRVFP